MALSYVDYTGDGSTTDYTIPFGYIDQSHIHAYLAGLEVTAFSWISATQIRMAVAPGNGINLRLKRITPNTSRLVDFQNGSALDADQDLDRDSNQMFYITQELVDAGVAGTTSTQDQFTASGTNTVFTLSAAPTSGSTPVVTVNGVTKTQGIDYTISGQTVTFTSPPPPGAIVVITYTITSSSGGVSSGGGSNTSNDGWTYDVFTGDGTTTGFVLKAPPILTAAMDVAVNGLTKTPGTDYLLSGQTITFLSAPTAGQTILVRYGAPVPATAIAMVSEFRTATTSQTTFNLTSTYQPGTNTMMVFVNGLILVPGVDYTETNTTTVTINIPLVGGDSVLFIYGNPINTNTVDGARLIAASVDGGTKIIDGTITLAKLAAALQSQLSAAQTYTGEVRWFYFTTAPSGWLECNGGTIGNGASGGTARANADTQSLFTSIWTNIANTEAPIQDSTGAATTRGASAAADFAANKRLPLPDLRGEFLRGWDHGRGVDSGRAIGAWQADQIKAHTHTYTGPGAGSGNGAGQSSSTQTSGSTGGAETRPRNVAMMPCIKL